MKNILWAFVALLALFVFAHVVQGDALLLASIPLGSIVQLRKKRAKLIDDARSILDEARGGALTSEQQQRFDAYMAEADKLKLEIDREERLADIERELDRPNPLLTQGTYAIGDAEPGNAARRDPRYAQAFRNWIRHGPAGLSTEERYALATGVFEHGSESRALGTAPGAAGGHVVPQDFYERIERAMLDFGGMLQAGCTILPTENGRDLPIPMGNDTGNVGAIVEENPAEAIGEEDTAFTQVTLEAFMYTSKIVRVSLQLLQDSAIDMEQYLANILAERIWRVLNNHLTVGTGNGQPMGVVTAAAEGKVGQSPLTVEDLMDLEHSVPRAYRTRAKFMASDSTIKALRKMKDQDDRLIWVPGIALRQPDTILGYTYIVNDDMPEMTELGARSILFGDFGKYFIRKVREFQLIQMREQYAPYLQVGFLGFCRWDGDLIDAGTHPIRYYQNPAV